MQLRSLLEFAVQGKHFLMNMFIDQLKDEGIQDDQIIHINFEDLAFNNLKNQMDLYKFVHEHENKENILTQCWIMNRRIHDLALFILSKIESEDKVNKVLVLLDV